MKKAETFIVRLGNYGKFATIKHGRFSGNS
jgi:hypothetical protein